MPGTRPAEGRVFLCTENVAVQGIVRPHRVQQLLDALSTFQISNEGIGISVPAGKYSAAEGADMSICPVDLKCHHGTITECTTDHWASPPPFANLPRALMSMVIPFSFAIRSSIAGPAAEQTAHSTGSGVLVALATLALSIDKASLYRLCGQLAAS